MRKLLPALIFISACGQSPKLPLLPKYVEHPVQKVVLSERIGAKEVRELFDALNSDKSISALELWLKEMSDRDLEVLCDLFSRYFVEEASTRDGAVALLKANVLKKNFTRLNRWWEKEARVTDIPHFVEMLWRIGNRRDINAIAFEGLPLADPKLVSGLRFARELSLKSYVHAPVEKFRAESELLPTGLYEDLRLFFTTEGHKEMAVGEISVVGRFGIASSVLKATLHLRDKFGGHAFEGVGLGFWNMSQEKPADGTGRGLDNQIEQLFRFADYGSRDTRGLLETLKTKISENPELVRALGRTLQSDIARMLSVLMWERLDEKEFNREFWVNLGTANEERPSPAFLKLHASLIDSFQFVLGPLRGPNDPQSFNFNSLIHLNAFAFAKRIEQIAHENVDAIKALPEGAGFLGRLQDLEIKSPALAIDYAEKTESGAWLFPWEAEMLKTPAKDFVPVLRRQLSSEVEGLTDYQNRFPALENPRAFSKAAGLAMDTVNATQPFLPADIVLSVAALNLARSEVPMLLESANLIDGINGLLPAGVEHSRAIKRVLFEGLNLGRLEPSERAQLISLFSSETKPEHRMIVAGALDSFQALYELDKKVEGTLSTPFDFYQAVATYTSKQELPWISAGLRFAAKTKMFSLAGEPGERSAQFPTLYQFIRSRRLAKFLSQLSEMSLEESNRLLDAIEPHLKPGSFSRNWDIVRDALENDPKGAVYFLDRWLSPEAEYNLKWLTELDPEYDWLKRFVDRGDFDRFRRSIASKGTRSSGRQLVTQLLRLQKEGTLRRIFQLLKNVDHTGLRTFAENLILWDTSGELVPFLELSEKALRGGRGS